MSNITEELEKTANEITVRDINDEIRELDSEFQAIVPVVVGDVITEVVQNKLSEKVKKEISNEIIIKLNNRANALGSAFIQKKVLRFRGTLIKRAMELANGIRIRKLVKGQPVIYDVAPDPAMIKHLLGYIDGSRPIGIVKEKKESNKGLGEFLNGQE